MQNAIGTSQCEVKRDRYMGCHDILVTYDNVLDTT